MKSARLLIAIAAIGIFIFLLASYLSPSPKVFSVHGSNVVISEVQVGGGTADDEFVELYNPTGGSVDLAGWRLTRKTAGGTESNLVASLSGMIPSHGFFLVTHPDYDGSPAADQLYSATTSAIANNNSLTLYSDAGVTTVDLVGLGTATASESATIDNPVTNGSVERKANSSSTSTSIGPGGSDETAGNGEDTDNNSMDFVERAISDPQNGTSGVEPQPASPTPTESPTPTPSETPTPSLTPTESPTPTLTPTQSPTPIITPTETPTPSPTVTPTPTPPLNPTVQLRGPLFSCTFEYLPIRIFGFTFRMPKITCARN